MHDYYPEYAPAGQIAPVDNRTDAQRQADEDRRIIDEANRRAEERQREAAEWWYSHTSPEQRAFWTVASVASGAAGVYHGYRRHKGSIGWGLWWGFMGSLFPVVTPALAVAQGFGKPMKRR